MKAFRLLLVLLLGVLPCTAQEYASREVRLGEVNNVQAGKPVDVTKKSSEAALRYETVPVRVFSGDYLTGLVFRGYNPGPELKRRMTVKVSVDFLEMAYSTVFDGTCTILSGGTADACIPLLSIEFDKPLLIKENMARLNVNIVSTGDAASEPVYFEQQVTEFTAMPAVQLNLRSEVADFNPVLKNQDSRPVADARVSISNDVLHYEATSDYYGQLSFRVEEANAPYTMRVSAPGYPDYETASFYLKQQSFDNPNLIAPPTEVMLSNRLEFRANKQATIILPEAPDASWGRYYRLDRHEGATIIFVREYEPKANTPYVIFPDKNFSINLSDYDLSQLPAPGIVRFPGDESGLNYGFYGTYKSQFVGGYLFDGEYAFIIDSTADCTEMGDLRYQMGAFRAYLILGTFNPYIALTGPEYVFEGEQTGISDVEQASQQAGACFDLQGRRLSGVPQRGMYIRNGRKYVVK